MENGFVSVKGLKVIGKGQCGNVYELSQDKIIKVFNQFVPVEDIEKERRNAVMMYDLGIPAANAYEIVETEEGKGLIYDYIKAESLQTLMKREPENMSAYSEECGRLCKKIHGISIEGRGFKNAKDEFTERLEAAEELITELYDLDTYNRLKDLIMAVPDKTGIVHGDFHPDNILVRDGKFYIIDMADVMMGNPVFDLLSLYFLRVNKCTYTEFIEHNLNEIEDLQERKKAADIISKQKNRSSFFDEKESAVFINGFLKGYYPEADEKFIAEKKRIIDGYSYLYMAEIIRGEGFLGKDIVRISTKEGVRVLLERYDEIYGK